MRPLTTALLLCALPLAPMAAQGWIDTDDRPVVGPIRASPAVVRVASDVRIRVTGRIARFEVTERFRNTGGGLAEGTYHYPMPGEAVFSDFSLFQGEQELTGEMMTAEDARTIYETIVRRMKDPALLTLVGHGLVRAQVFPIQPGETRTVVLRFTQLLPRADDALRIRYAAGSRGDAPVTMTIDADGAEGFATAYSPTNEVDESRTGGRLRVTVAPPVRGDVDVVLPIRRGLVGGTVLTHAQPGEDGFALLFLAPPPATEELGVPRDVTFVVDISGSMSGEKMTQARTALHQALGSLGPRDRFRVIAFSNAVRHFREGYAAASRATLDAARRFVDDLHPTGGTNLAGAVEAALAARGDAERMPIVFLLTDGLPSVGEQAPDRIAANAAGHIGRTRIFTFGVGQDVNTYLLDRLAVEGRGSATYVSPGADASDAMGTVIARVSRPALVDLRIVSSPVRLLDRAPATLPDLFFGEELVVLARYQGSGSGPVVIEGTRNGRRERFTIQATFARHEADNAYVPQLWASRRIGELSRQIRLEGSSPDLIEQVRTLGLRYGILTEYTSYLVQEPGVQAELAARIPAAPAGAGAARQMTGDRAFEAAKASSNMAASTSLAAADEAINRRIGQVAPRREREAGRADRDGEVVRAGGRLFANRNGTWTDVAHRPALRVTTVAPFSPAWFELAKARPALAPALGVGTPAILAGQRTSLEVAEGGLTQWAPGALARFLREFEGT